jgi:hypothetical protein
VFAPVVVQVQNLHGTPLATNGVAVTLALNSGNGTLSGTTTQTTDPTGQATFNNLSINLAGTKILTASSPPWVTPVSSPVLIVSGLAAQLRVTSSPASPQKQGYTFSPAPTVQVLDPFGNIVSNSTALVTASSASSGAGTLTGTLGVNADGLNGSATFGNLHYTLGNPGQAESVVLYFNSPGLVTATNSPFLVYFVPGMLTLTNGNSLVQIDPNSQNGVFAWVVDGTSQLFQQWFWLRWPNGPQISFDQLGTPLGTSWTATNAIITYLPQGLAVTLSFTLQGGAAGSGASSLAETISLQNTNASSVNLHLYDYTDLDLGGTDAGDTVSFPTNNLVAQQGKGVTATQSVQGPMPSFWEASWYSLVFDTINSATPAVLSDTILPNQPGDQTFAYQWDLTLGAGQTLVFNLANTLRMPRVPSLSIARSGANVLLLWPTNGADNLKLQSNGSLNASGAWTNVLTNPATVDTNYQVALPPAGVAQFFRLH